MKTASEIDRSVSQTDRQTTNQSYPQKPDEMENTDRYAPEENNGTTYSPLMSNENTIQEDSKF